MADKPREPVKKNPLQELIDKMPAYATKADLVQAIRTNIKSNIQARFQSPVFVNNAEEPTPPVEEPTPPVEEPTPPVDETPA